MHLTKTTTLVTIACLSLAAAMHTKRESMEDGAILKFLNDLEVRGEGLTVQYQTTTRTVRAVKSGIAVSVARIVA
ncbi:hypothetical protein QQZ08_008009 [Neonectria magnoliae]|uniref:Uncharacterized protein n=1 Tax=Neonectria magnoliae TaxID=2732573 RepID=A0ABR1HY63_9HYPO